MTNLQRDSAGSTARFTPPTGASLDILGLANPSLAASLNRPRLPARLSTPVKLDKEGKLYFTVATIYDLHNGLNGPQHGLFTELHDSLTVSTFDTRFPRHATFCFLMTTNTSSDPSGFDSAPNVAGAFGIYGVNVFNTLVIAGGKQDGSGNGTVLFTETSATDPSPVAVTWNSGTANNTVYGARSIKLANLTAEKLAVCFSGSGVKVFSDITTPTLAGTMHNDTIGATDILQSPIAGDDNPLLIYGSSSIMSLKASAAITDQPSVVTPNVIGGGWGMGFLNLGGAGPVRAYWVMPTVAGVIGHGTSFIDSASAPYGRIMSTNAQGTDLQPLTTFGLKGIRWAEIMPSRACIVASDGESIEVNNGRSHPDLHWNSNPVANSDRVRRAMGCWIRGDDLFVLVDEKATNGSVASQQWIEWYDWDLDTWHIVQRPQTLSTTGYLSVNSGHGLPASNATGFLHGYSDSAWIRQFQPPSGQNPFNYRKSSSTAGSGTGQAYASSATATMGNFQIPGFEGWMMVPKWVAGNPDVDAGGTGATVSLAIYDGDGNSIFPQAQFQQGKLRGRQFFPAYSNRSYGYELQLVITAAQQSGGTDPTRFTVNALPLSVGILLVRPDVMSLPMNTDIDDATR